MSESGSKKIKWVVKEYGPINDFLLDYLSKVIPNYGKKIVFSDYGKFSDLEELLIQLEIAMGMDDNRYRKDIPVFVKLLKIRFGELLAFIERKKLEYIA